MHSSINETAFVIPWKNFLLGIRACESQQKILEIYVLNLDWNCGKPTDIWNARVLQNPRSLEGVFVEYMPGKKGFVKENDPSLNQGDQVFVQLLFPARDDKPPTFSSSIQYPGLFSVWKPGQATHRISQSLSTEAQTNWKKSLRAEALPPEILIRTLAQECSKEKLAAVKSEATRARSLIEQQSQTLKLFEKLETNTAFEHIAFKLLTNKTVALHTTQAWLEKGNELLSYNSGNRGIAECKGLGDLPLELKKELKSCLAPLVSLPSGGSVYFEQTKAMHTVDVNSAGYSSKIPYEQAVLKINQEAASCIGQQICLRNLSGLLAIDFISNANDTMLEELAEIMTPVLKRGKQKFEISNVATFGVCMASRRRNGLTLHEALGGQSSQLHGEL